jgi:hypothetical protein
MLRAAIDRPSAVDDTTGARIWPYPLADLDLRREITRVLLERELIDAPVPLEDLHLAVREDDQKRDENFLSKVSLTFYETDTGFQNVYFRLLQHFAAAVFGEDVIFQRHPALRFHFPMRSGALTKKHRARDGELLWHHSDLIYGHPFEEINCWLPLTRCFASNTLALGSLAKGKETLAGLAEAFAYDDVAFHQRGHERFFARLDDDLAYRRAIVDDCRPVVIEPGSLLTFDPRCFHSTLENHEDKTRVSLDFRVIPVRAYERMARVYPELQGDVTFTKGSFFHPQSTSELKRWEPLSSRRRAR